MASNVSQRQAPAAEGAVQRRPTPPQIGRYALKGLLAPGGPGQVHEAWDPLLSRIVALKLLPFDADADATQRDRFGRSVLDAARAAAGLSHDHLVTVHDAGLYAHGVYVVMERLRGMDLRQRLAQGWVPTPAQAARLVQRLADALAHAHERGVVHGGVAPATIFVSRHGHPKLLDVGIARLARSPAGSAHYLAPEQLGGAPVDARTDVHALGVVFYELLTLRKAFAGDSVEQIATAVLTNHPAPAHELRSLVPRRLSVIAAKAMAREPARRHASAAELAQELQRWLDRNGSDGDAVFDGVPRTAAPAPRPAPRAPTRVLLAAACGVVLALAALKLQAAPAAAVAAEGDAIIAARCPHPMPRPNPRLNPHPTASRCASTGKTPMPAASSTTPTT